MEETRFGDLLRRLRLAAELSQRELAERAGLSPQAISALERGIRRAPYRHTLDALATALALDPADRLALHAAAQRRRGNRPPDGAASLAVATSPPSADCTIFGWFSGESRVMGAVVVASPAGVESGARSVRVAVAPLPPLD